MARELPSGEEFLAQVGGMQALESQLPDRPVSSLRDLQFLYGRLYTLATVGEGEYASYLTPDQARDLLEEPDSLIAVRVDLTGDQPRLDTANPVEVTSYTEEEGHVQKAAHCKYDSARGIDHSVTHRSGRDKEPEKLAEYAIERLDRWATDEEVQSVADEHEDGWIIRELATLGEEDVVRQEITESVVSMLGGPRTSLLTVRVKRPGDDEYRWPGELDVFAEAMKRRKLSKLVSKNAASESIGEATGMLTGARMRTVGTAEDPLNYFLGKQMEKFPGFDPDEAWRSHPISEDAAVTVMNAEPFVEACTYNAFAATIYAMPYFVGTPDAETALELYRLLRNTMEQEDMTPIEYAYDFYDGQVPRENPLRFYISAVKKQQSKRFDVFGDTMNGRLLHPVDQAEAHVAVLDSWAYDGGDVPAPLRPPLPTDEHWDLIAPGSDFLPLVVSGWYFARTFSAPDDDTDAAVDDARIDALVSVLSGDPIPVEVLLEEYVKRLIEEEDGEQFPSYHTAMQFAQLCALASNDLLVANDERRAIAEAPTYDSGFTMPEPTMRADGGASAAVARDQKLEQFIDQTPAFENPERRGSFLLGALVGQVAGYQSGSENRSTTLVDQYSIKSMTKTRFKRVTEEVIDKDVVYSRENHMSTTMYAEVVDRLRTALTTKDPDEWTISTDDLRFYYALGVSYGLNNWTDGSEEDD